MRSIIVILVALALTGGTSALSFIPAPSPVDGAITQTDAIIASFSRVHDPTSAMEAAFAAYGLTPSSVGATRSNSLEAAILRTYAAYDVAVDDALAREISRQASHAASPALVELFDALADAQFASLRIWSPADQALVTTDLATTLKTITLRPDSPEAHAALAALARADLPLAAAAALRVASALPHLPELVPVEGCARVLDLPFIQVGAPCDDVYSADTINFVQIDYGGNDTYLNNAGAGIAGVGVGLSLDYGHGRDTYRAVSGAQGSAIAGAGILYDDGGPDLYNVTSFGQGWGTAGIGLLFDAGTGDDIYESPHTPASIATKAGGLGGVGILVDEGGSDHYQQDGLDGFVYGAAGAGILIEMGQGDDLYLTRDLAIFLLDTFIGEIVGPVQVSAEVFGLAILYEEGGDDTYICGGHVRQGCQGAGGIGATAMLLDLAGDDHYILGESVGATLADVTDIPELSSIPVFPAGQGVAYGEGSAPPGFGLGILRDLGGDDIYIGPAASQGYATGGLGLLLDERGFDAYHAVSPLAGARANGQTWADGLALGVGIDR